MLLSVHSESVEIMFLWHKIAVASSETVLLLGQYHDGSLIIQVTVAVISQSQRSNSISCSAKAIDQIKANHAISFFFFGGGGARQF